MKMMKRVAVLAVLAAMLGVSAAAEAGTGRLDMMMQRGSNLKRCGPKGNGAKCGDGECCSKFGFCGTTPFHCDSTKGCESQCKEAKAGGSEPQPVVAESSSSEDAVQIVVKTISNAVPLCTDCPKAEPAPAASSGSSGDDSSDDSEESSEDESSGAPADPVNPSSEDSTGEAATDAPDAAARGAAADDGAATTVTTDAGDVSPAGNGKVKSELEAIRKIQADGVAQAKQILADAKDKAKQTKGPKPRAAAMPKGPLDQPVNVLDREGY